MLNKSKLKCLISILLIAVPISLVWAAGGGTGAGVNGSTGRGGPNADGGGGGDSGPGGTGCGKIEIDCSTHKMKISGKQVTIDCGKRGKTPSCENGRVGGLHSGPIVKDGVKIVRCGNAEQRGVVFHVRAGGGQPKGENSSNGCIHVSKDILTKLKSCQGSFLSIKGTDGGGGAGSSQGQTGNGSSGPGATK